MVNRVDEHVDFGHGEGDVAGKQFQEPLPEVSPSLGAGEEVEYSELLVLQGVPQPACARFLRGRGPGLGL